LVRVWVKFRSTAQTTVDLVEIFGASIRVVQFSRSAKQASKQASKEERNSSSSSLPFIKREMKPGVKKSECLQQKSATCYYTTNYLEPIYVGRGVEKTERERYRVLSQMSVGKSSQNLSLKFLSTRQIAQQTVAARPCQFRVGSLAPKQSKISGVLTTTIWFSKLRVVCPGSFFFLCSYPPFFAW
jgi:hypothetical protein